MSKTWNTSTFNYAFTLALLARISAQKKRMRNTRSVLFRRHANCNWPARAAAGVRARLAEKRARLEHARASNAHACLRNAPLAISSPSAKRVQQEADTCDAVIAIKKFRGLTRQPTPRRHLYSVTRSTIHTAGLRYRHNAEYHAGELKQVSRT